MTRTLLEDSSEELFIFASKDRKMKQMKYDLCESLDGNKHILYSQYLVTR